MRFQYIHFLQPYTFLGEGSVLTFFSAFTFLGEGPVLAFFGAFTFLGEGPVLTSFGAFTFLGESSVLTSFGAFTFLGEGPVLTSFGAFTFLGEGPVLGAEPGAVGLDSVLALPQSCGRVTSPPLTAPVLASCNNRQVFHHIKCSLQFSFEGIYQYSIELS